MNTRLYWGSTIMILAAVAHIVVEQANYVPALMGLVLLGLSRFLQDSVRAPA